MTQIFHRRAATALRRAAICCCILVGAASAAQAAEPKPPAAPDLHSTQASSFETVEIDDYMQRNQPPTRNGRMIVPLRGVRFEATIAALPEPREISYLYTALGVMGVKDAPKVSHRMVLSSPAQRRFAVYVPDDLLARLRDARVSQAAQFTGFHVYTYANGPAILVTGVVLH